MKSAISKEKKLSRTFIPYHHLTNSTSTTKSEHGLSSALPEYFQTSLGDSCGAIKEGITTPSYLLFPLTDDYQLTTGSRINISNCTAHHRAY